jgi:hypothetical protein
MNIEDLKVTDQFEFKYAYWLELTNGELVNMKGKFGTVTKLLGESFIATIDEEKLPTLFLNSCSDKIELTQLTVF